MALVAMALAYGTKGPGINPRAFQIPFLFLGMRLRTCQPKIDWCLDFQIKIHLKLAPWEITGLNKHSVGQKNSCDVKCHQKYNLNEVKQVMVGRLINHSWWSGIN